MLSNVLDTTGLIPFAFYMLGFLKAYIPVYVILIMTLLSLAKSQLLSPRPALFASIYPGPIEA